MAANPAAQLERLAALHDPVRRELYLYVCGRPGPVGRDEAARAAGISRALAAFHLDRLAADGLLDVEYRRLTTRRGPGAGRPAKLYRRAGGEIEFSLPPRDYRGAARLLARALAAEPDGRGKQAPCHAALASAAHEAGRALGAAAGGGARGGAPGNARGATRGRARGGATTGRSAILRLLRRAGYEPVREPDGDIRLHNCPFDALAKEQRELICGMNLALLEGAVAGLGGDRTAVLDPRPGCCCVVLRRSRET
jgi:predicted ArsR family transcriptional regulator